jgi:hypothetical protein
MKFYPLGIIREAIMDQGLNLTYAYEDLVFIEHNAYLIQFTQNDSLVKIHFNMNCPDPDSDDIYKRLKRSCKNRDITLEKGSRFVMNQKENEELEILFQ